MTTTTNGVNESLRQYISTKPTTMWNKELGKKKMQLNGVKKTKKEGMKKK